MFYVVFRILLIIFAPTLSITSRSPPPSSVPLSSSNSPPFSSIYLSSHPLLLFLFFSNPVFSLSLPPSLDWNLICPVNFTNRLGRESELEERELGGRERVQRFFGCSSVEGAFEVMYLRRSYMIRRE